MIAISLLDIEVFGFSGQSGVRFTTRYASRLLHEADKQTGSREWFVDCPHLLTQIKGNSDLD
jgi:hypothetical protein